MDWDSDNDGVVDGDELAGGTDPCGAEHEVSQEGVKYTVIFYVNATVSDIGYDEDTRELSFNLTGEAGATARCSIEMPRSMWPEGGITVLVDGEPVDYTLTWDAEMYYMEFCTTLSDATGGVAEVVLSYSIDGGTTWSNKTMSPAGGAYEAVIPGQPAGRTVVFKIYARDNAGNWAVATPWELGHRGSWDQASSGRP